jgi:hypothetical protein
VPGACLLGVAPAVAAGLLAFNVFYLRVRHPGAVSGKLSDVAIAFLLPVVLVAAVEWTLALVQAVRRRPFAPLGARGRLAACAVAGAYFALLKAWPPFTALHRGLLALLDAPLGGGRAFRNTPDPTDLFALVVLPLAALYLVRHLRHRRHRRHGNAA